MTIGHIKTAFTQLLEHKTTPFWLLAGITLLAAGLRFYKLGEWSFWIDEIYTINRAQIHFSDPLTVLRNLPSTLWLPVSVIFTEGFIKVFGVNEWSARLASTIIGIVSIPVLFFASRKLIGSTAALISVFLLAISPWHLYWSQNARFYTSLMFLCSLALITFFHAIERDRPFFILIFYVLFYLALSERLIAIFILPVIFLYVFGVWAFRLDRPPGWRRRNIVIFLAPLAALVFGDLIRLLNGESVVQDAIIVFGDSPNHSPLRFLFSVVYRIDVSILCLSIFGGGYLLHKRNRSGWFVFLAATVPVLLLTMLANFMFTIDRYIFFTLPFWAILCAVAIEALFRHSAGAGKILALSIVLLVAATYLSEDMLYFKYQHGNRPDWRGAFALIEEHKLRDDQIYSTLPEIGHYYLGEEVKDINLVNLKELTQSMKRIWFVIDSDISDVESAIKEWIQTNSVLFEVIEVILPGKSMNLRIYQYDPRR